jgi:hypothetical protein
MRCCKYVYLFVLFCFLSRRNSHNLSRIGSNCAICKAFVVMIDVILTVIVRFAYFIAGKCNVNGTCSPKTFQPPEFQCRAVSAIELFVGLQALTTINVDANWCALSSVSKMRWYVVRSMFARVEQCNNRFLNRQNRYVHSATKTRRHRLSFSGG